VGGDGGGIVSLRGLLERRWRALEADFARYYQLNLTEALFGRQVDLRRLYSLIAHLPPDSATVRAETGPWVQTEPLLYALTDLTATLIELLDENNRITYGAATSGKRKLRDPLKIRRPWRIEQPRTPATPREIARFFRARR
jgi:hypothetical protein